MKNEGFIEKKANCHYGKMIISVLGICSLIAGAVMAAFWITGTFKGQGKISTIEAHNDLDDELYVIFTVDVEDKRGGEPNLIEGDLSDYGIEQNCGMNYIMDTFEKYGARAVFFVNVYEHYLYNESYMPDLLKRIDRRGHEVALHCHPSYSNGLLTYSKELYQYDEHEQYNILKYGCDYISSAIGRYPVSFRAGGYRVNDDTYKALQEVGIRIDSSLWSDNIENNVNLFGEKRNMVFEQNGIVEFPVVAVFGDRGWTKLDIDSMAKEDIIKVFEAARNNSCYNVIQIMFHSFSFMDQSGSDQGDALIIEDEEPREGTKYINGEDQADKEKLEAVLDYLSRNDKYKIITFREYLDKNINIIDYSDKNDFYIGPQELAFSRKNVTVRQQGEGIVCKNDWQSPEKLQYGWEVVNINDTDEKYFSGYGAENQLYYFEFPTTANGTYNVKSWVKNEKNQKIRGIYFRCIVKNGLILEIEEK